VALYIHFPIHLLGVHRGKFTFTPILKVQIYYSVVCNDLSSLNHFQAINVEVKMRIYGNVNYKVRALTKTIFKLFSEAKREGAVEQR
jgi:hypothetical protein